jgi:hypothetical protein
MTASVATGWGRSSLTQAVAPWGSLDNWAVEAPPVPAPSGPSRTTATVQPKQQVATDSAEEIEPTIFWFFAGCSTGFIDQISLRISPVVTIEALFSLIQPRAMARLEVLRAAQRQA